MSSLVTNLEKLVVPLEEIKLATRDFSEGGVDGVYEGQLSERWKNCKAFFKVCVGRKEFRKELDFISSFNHENIIPFIGYCDEEGYMVIVYEYPVNCSLADHLGMPHKRSRLTWAQRLNICLGAARGLNYLHHTGLGGEQGSIIHGCLIKENILLDKDMKAKICDFQFSELILGNRQRPQVYKLVDYESARHWDSHWDPIYLSTGFLKAESDVYSFGVLLFEMLTDFEKPMDAHRKERDLIIMVRRCYDYGLDKLVDPVIRDQIGRSSFDMLKEVAYKCISYNIKDRPTMDRIVKTIEQAVDIHNHGAASTVTKRRSEHENPESFLIPLEEIKLATENFSPKSKIQETRYSDIYKGKLSERWQNLTAAIKRYRNDVITRREDCFRNELDIVSSFHHENILSYIGYCEEGNEMILVYEHAINGSLVDHLQDLTWERRLKICIGAARGIKCLHSGLWEENRVIHRRVESENIYLDENMEAKISGFEMSVTVSRNQPQVIEGLQSNFDDMDYLDPIYEETDVVNVEVDVYSFGVILFEMLSGLPAYRCRSFGENDIPQNLIKWVHRYYYDELEKLIDPFIRDQIDSRSLHTFTEIAYKCLSFNIKDRPSMNRIIKRMEEALYIQNHGAVATTTIQSHRYENLEDLLIPLKEINLATCDFSKKNLIGDGGFGVVYKGRLSESRQNREVAIKRLDRNGHQGKNEFLNELKLISRFNHQNIIPFIGYCDEGNEMILVYEYAINGSLDHHLQDPKKKRRLTWAQRLKICVGAARGLDYLHSGLGEDNRVIHRDVKSGNILLDDKLEAKICDFGLSKSGIPNQPHTQLYTNAAGTNFYMDPIYHESGILRKESDVYSFGVVMFEMLSGMLAYYRRSFGDGKPQPLINLVRRYYDYRKDFLIDPQIKDQIDNSSFQTFIEVAYQCISFRSKERPTMETIVDKLEEAQDFQVKKEASEKVEN